MITTRLAILTHTNAIGKQMCSRNPKTLDEYFDHSSVSI